ncbi:hypothetical protein EDC01DRAFT_675582 [Geopyxis carbonaria]|nr:hypothetical protein EDC01DRAFT_675582 [Geopyxis carbonaria]
MDTIRSTISEVSHAVSDAAASLTSAASSSSIPAGSWVLLTGANGFVATHVLTALLDAGYKVKCSVRSQAKIDGMKALRTPEELSRLQFCIVPDVAAPGAHDEAVKGVVAVVHTASPFVLGDQDDNAKSLLNPAIDGTRGVLESIERCNPAVKRVVVTSSFASIIDLEKELRPGYTYTEKDWNGCTYEAAARGSGTVAYCASKALAEKAAWDFHRERKPAWGLATVCPPMVYGPLEHEADLKALNTSSQDIYRLIDGSTKAVPDTAFFAWVDVRDVGLAHLRAMERTDSERYFTTAGPFTYKDIVVIIAKHFPELVEQGRTPKPETAGDIPPHYNVDNSKSRRDLGLQYRSLETCVVDLVDSLLHLEAKAKGQTYSKKGPVSVTDIRTGEEHRPHSVGKGKTVCECGGAGACACKPGECVCEGCMKGRDGPEPGKGAVLKDNCGCAPGTCEKAGKSGIEKTSVGCKCKDRDSCSCAPGTCEKETDMSKAFSKGGIVLNK